MSNVAKVAGAAANTLTTPLNVEEVFSTYLLDNSGTVNNGIDLAGEGGLLWTKWRSGGASAFYQNHFLYDTERGYGSTDYLHSNNTDAAGAAGAIGSGSFNSDGFTTGGNIFSGNEWASWTFRKAPKFFDVVTYTGDGTASNAIPHNLGITPACIIVKPRDTASFNDWRVWHKDLSGQSYQLKLNTTDAEALVGNFISQNDTTFTVGYTAANESGINYVAYLFAHNDGDGEFGPDADADIIKCGSYTGNGSNTGPEIDLGFEPQWLLVKRTNTSGYDWELFDNMRGIVSGANDPVLSANTTAAESSPDGYFDLLPNGFQYRNPAGVGGLNDSGANVIYIAIRRGPMAVPEDADDVFDGSVDFDENTGGSGFKTSFVADMALWRQPQTSDEFRFSSRLMQGKKLRFDTSLGENTDSHAMWDFMDGFYNNNGANSNFDGWLWGRRSNFFDLVCYTGTGASRNISHNLGVAPEMMWVKRRDNTDMWKAYHSGLGNTKYIRMDGDFDGARAAVTNSFTWNNTSPTESVFTVGTAGDVNGSGEDYVACLFASLDGISKVGTYTGNGSSQTINCGFSAGARFILIKRTDSTGDWYVWDTERGIVAANDPHLSLNTTAAEVTTNDSIDPDNSGFIVNQVSATNINVSSATYIFYAIA